MESKNDKVKAKIQKVLALLEGAKTEGEAQAASLKLQELLIKNNLSIEEVKASVGVSAEVEELSTDIGSGSGTNWKCHLANVIAENYRCETFIRKWRTNGHETGKSVVFVGETEDAKLAEKVFVVTLEVASRLFKKWCKDTRKDKKAAHEAMVAEHPEFGFWKFSWSPRSAERNGWYIGFVNGLADAYREQVESDSELAMVLVTPTSVREHMEELSKGFNRSRRFCPTINPSAYESGLATGQSYGTGTALAC